MNNPWLSNEQLVELTGYQRRAEQRRELDAAGIAYRMRTNGTLIVLRSELGQSDQKMVNNAEPDYSAA